MRPRALTVGFLSFIVGGCAASDPPPRAALSPRDFAPHTAPPISPAVTLAPSAVPARTGSQGPTEITGPVAASEGIMDVSASPGEPELGPPGTPMKTVTGELVEGVVGRVNNKAIYVNEFLGRMAKHLEAEASRRSRDAWTAFARKLITEELNRQIEDELLLAEARASFVTPEQRAGLRAYLEAVQSNILSGSGGSRQKATQSLMEKEGRSVDEELKFREERDLIELELDRMNRRINVPFREVALSYERQYDKYNPKPVAEFHLIRVGASRAEEIASITGALAGAEDFATVAARPSNEYRKESGGAVVVEFSGDYATAEFFGLRALNEAAHSITPGRWAGPITSNDYVWWLHLDRINRTTMSLYDAQLSLEAGLRSRLSGEARYKLLQRLKERASFTRIDVMVEQLLKAATERYFLPTRG